MNIVIPSRYHRRTRSLAEGALQMWYRRGPSVLKQHAEFDYDSVPKFNISDSDFWSVSMFFNCYGGNSSTLSSTGFGCLLARQIPYPANNVHYHQGVSVAYRTNSGTTGNYGDATKPKNSYRIEILLGDKYGAARYLCTGFDFLFNTTIHLAVTTTSLTNTSAYKVYVNGIERPIVKIISMGPASLESIGMGVYDRPYKIGEAEFDYGWHTANKYGLNGLISNLSILSKAISIEEAQHIHETGLIPPSAHAWVQYYFPLSHSGGKKLWNAVEQFNYARSTAVSSTHGNLINFTDIEAGAVSPSSQQVWLEFHKKTQPFLRNYFYAKNWTGNSNDNTLGGHPDYFHCPHVAAHEWGTQDIEVEITFALKTTFSGFQSNLFYKPGTEGLVVCGIDATGFYLLLRFPAQLGLEGWIYTTTPPEQLMMPGKFHTVRFRKVTANATLWEIYFDGKKQPTRVQANQLPENFNATVTGAARFFTTTSTVERELKFRELKLTIGSTLVSHWQANNSESAYIHDIKGVANIFMQHKVNPEHTNVGGRAWRENKSQKPPITSALLFRKASSQHIFVSGFSPTKERGYSIILGYVLPSAREVNGDDYFMSQATSLTNGKLYRCTGTGNNVQAVQYDNGTPQHLLLPAGAITNKLRMLVYLENPNDSQNSQVMYQNGERIGSIASNGVGILGFDQFASSLHFGTVVGGSRRFDGYLFYAAIAKGLLTEQQIKYLNNNQEYQLPPPSWENVEWELIINFGKIMVSGTSYTMEDLSGKGRVIGMTNFTSAQVTPGNAEYALTPINNLK